MCFRSSEAVKTNADKDDLGRVPPAGRASQSRRGGAKMSMSKSGRVAWRKV